MKDVPDTIRQADNVLLKILPILQKEKAVVVADVTCRLFAWVIAGHPPRERSQAHTQMLKLIEELTPLMVERMIDEGTVQRGR